MNCSATQQLQFTNYQCVQTAREQYLLPRQYFAVTRFVFVLMLGVRIPYRDDYFSTSLPSPPAVLDLDLATPVRRSQPGALP